MLGARPSLLRKLPDVVLKVVRLPLYAALSIAFVLCTTSGWTWWQFSDEPVCIGGGDNNSVHTISDGEDGSISAWLMGSASVSVQRLNSHGKQLWGSMGRRVSPPGLDSVYPPRVASDGAGGAIVAYQESTIMFFSYYSSTRIQRVDAAGNLMWGANGTYLGTTMMPGYEVDVISDGAGGAIATWIHQDSSGAEVRVQRVNSAGAKQWGYNGVRLDTSVSSYRVHPRIVSDGSGGAIIAWMEFGYGGGSRANYAQRVNSSGVPQWASPAALLASGVATTPYTPEGGDLTSDGAGGAILTWADSRTDSENDVYAQRISGAGTVQWTVNGVPVAQVGGAQKNPVITTDGLGGAIIAWYDQRSSGPGIYAQRVYDAGAMQWASNGIAVTTATDVQPNLAITDDGSTNAIITWSHRHTPQGPGDIDTLDIYAQKVNTAGQLQWGTYWWSGTVSVGRWDQTEPRAVKGLRGDFTFTWLDTRNGSSRDIYASRLDSDGVKKQDAADLALQKTVADPVTTLGELLHYTINVTNKGPETSYNVRLVDTLPTGCSFSTATASIGTIRYDADTISLQLASLETTESADIDVFAEAITTGVLVNTASVDSDVPDPVAGNNSGQVSSTVIEPEYGPCPASRISFPGPVVSKCKTTSKGLRCKVKASAQVVPLIDQPTPATSVCFYLSDDAEFDPSRDVLLLSRPLKSIKPGKVKAPKLSKSLALGTSVTGKYIIAVIGCSDPLISPCDRDYRMSVTGPME